MRRYIALMAIALLMLVCASCGKSKASTIPTQTPYERPTPTPYAGPYPEWVAIDGFSLFPMYTHGGEPEAGFEEGPSDAQGSARFALKSVTYDDYKAYIDQLKEAGFSLHNPFGEFVSQAEIELAALNGGATYMSEGYEFDLRYDLRLQTLIMQIDYS